MGCVGSALAAVLHDAHEVYVCDTKDANGTLLPPAGTDIDFLHVAIPWGGQFMNIVRETALRYMPNHTIVHSTVPVGTTRQLGINAVHSPVRGQHDSLECGLRTFVKYVGAQTQAAGLAAYRHLYEAGFRVEFMSSPEATEAAKLLCSFRYLNDLAFYQWVETQAANWGVDPQEVLLQWTESYNRGYAGTKFVRPQLDFPHGKVGGTCVMPNSRIVYGLTQSRFVERALELFGETPVNNSEQ